MVHPNNAIPQLSTHPSSSHDPNFQANINSSSLQRSPLSRRARGRPLGSKNKPKETLMTDELNENPLKPFLIQVPMDSDVIGAVIQFAHHHQVSITVLSASGNISRAKLRHGHSHDSTEYLGPFTLISLSGTYNPFVTPSLSSSATDHNTHCFFNISFSSLSRQSFIGVVGGEVIAANEVTVVATIFKHYEIPGAVINNGYNEDDDNNPN